MQDSRRTFSVRAARAVVASFLALSFAVVFGHPAQAAVKAKLPVEQHAWFWSSNTQFNLCSPDIPDEIRNQLPEALRNQYCTPSAYDLSSFDATPISPGHLGVGLLRGQNDMRSYVQVDMSAVPFGATIRSLVVELTVSRPAQAGSTDQDSAHTSRHAGKPPATRGEDTAEIRACLVRLPWARAEGAPPSVMDPNNPTESDPEEPWAKGGVDCSVSSNGSRPKPNGPWVFDLTPMVELWTTGGVFNLGVALMPIVTGPADSWTVEFHGNEFKRVIEDPATGGTTETEVVAKSEAPVATVVYDPLPAPPPVDGGGGALPPITIGPPPAAPPIQEPAPPVTSPEPQTSPTAGVLPLSQPRTPWYVYLLLPAGIFGFVAVSRAMGRELGDVGANRVAMVLRRRRAEA